MSRVGIVLLNLGGPERIQDVGPFLYNLFSDPEIIRLPIPALQKPLAWLISTLRSNKSQEAYRSIGGGSPLRRITDQGEHSRLPLSVIFPDWAKDFDRLTPHCSPSPSPTVPCPPAFRNLLGNMFQKRHIFNMFVIYWILCSSFGQLPMPMLDSILGPDLPKKEAG